MELASIVVEANGEDKRITVSYRDSAHFDDWHFIHKYYLAPEDKGKLFPVDICALHMMAYRDAEFEHELEIDLWHGVIPEKLPAITIYYRDLKLEKQLGPELVRCGLLAISAYQQELLLEPTAEEARAALNLNDWLRGYEKTLAAKQVEIEEGLQNGLRGADPFLVDYEINLEMQFYLREEDPFCDNDAANRHDWDIDAALMCNMEYISGPSWLSEINDPDYRGIGDNRDHNDMRGSVSNNPVRSVSHCELFHRLISHHGVPIKHLKRIGRIWTDFKVQYQTGVEIDLNCETTNVKQIETFTAKLDNEGRCIFREPLKRFST